MLYAHFDIYIIHRKYKMISVFPTLICQQLLFETEAMNHMQRKMKILFCRTT